MKKFVKFEFSIYAQDHSVLTGTRASVVAFSPNLLNASSPNLASLWRYVSAVAVASKHAQN